MSEVRDLVTTYFKGVDEENLDLILHTLHPDCVFSVETHNVCLTGHTEITAMFFTLMVESRLCASQPISLC